MLPTATPRERGTWVLVRDGLRLRAIDPTTGAVPWQLAVPADSRVGAVETEGMIYVSVAPDEAGGTDVWAVGVPKAATRRIARVAASAVVAAVRPDGDLTLLQFGTNAAAGPTRALTAPAVGRPRPPGASAVARDAGWGVLGPDGAWYHLRMREAPAASDSWVADVVSLAIRPDGAGTASTVSLPSQNGYASLLLAPDGRTLYVVDYPTTVVALDAAQHGIAGRAAVR